MLGGFNLAFQGTGPDLATDNEMCLQFSKCEQAQIYGSSTETGENSRIHFPDENGKWLKVSARMQISIFFLSLSLTQGQNNTLIQKDPCSVLQWQKAQTETRRSDWKGKRVSKDSQG